MNVAIIEIYSYKKKYIEKNIDAKKFVLSNEYNINPSIGVFKPYHLIANYEKIPKLANRIIGFSFINLNLLFAREPNKLINKKYDCIYYGTFRPNRKKYFQKYLKDKIYLSTTKKI